MSAPYPTWIYATYPPQRGLWCSACGARLTNRVVVSGAAHFDEGLAFYRAHKTCGEVAAKRLEQMVLSMEAGRP